VSLSSAADFYSESKVEHVMRIISSVVFQSLLLSFFMQKSINAFRQAARRAVISLPKSAIRPASSLTNLVQRKSSGSSINRLFRLGALAAMASTTTTEAAAAAIKQAPIETFRSDYKPSDFFVSDIFLSFQLDTQESVVTTTSQFTRSISPASKNADIVLDGEDLDLIQLKIGGAVIPSGSYTYEAGKLRIPSASFNSGKDLLVDKLMSNTTYLGLRDSSSLSHHLTLSLSLSLSLSLYLSLSLSISLSLSLLLIQLMYLS
jgi:hypothetical protein